MPGFRFDIVVAANVLVEKLLPRQRCRGKKIPSPKIQTIDWYPAM
jgi:hypothetical protein